jgi:hypothetical protein
MEGELKAEGREAGVVWFQGLAPFPTPPMHHRGGNLSTVCPPHAPYTLLSLAYDVILTISAPFGASPQWPCPRGPKGSHLKEETKLNNFLLYSFLIEDLGAELLAPKYQRKFLKDMRPPTIWPSAKILDCGAYFGLSGRYNQPVQYGRECANKSSAQAVHLSLGDGKRRTSHLRGPERELFSQTRRKSAAGDSAEPKQ